MVLSNEMAMQHTIDKRLIETWQWWLRGTFGGSNPMVLMTIVAMDAQMMRGWSTMAKTKMSHI